MCICPSKLNCLTCRYQKRLIRLQVRYSRKASGFLKMSSSRYIPDTAGSPSIAASCINGAVQNYTCVAQWDEVDQKFKVTEHTSTALKVSHREPYVATISQGNSSCCSVFKDVMHLCRVPRRQWRLSSARSTVQLNSNTAKRLKMRGYSSTAHCTDCCA